MVFKTAGYMYIVHVFFISVIFQTIIHFGQGGGCLLECGQLFREMRYTVPYIFVHGMLQQYFRQVLLSHGSCFGTMQSSQNTHCKTNQAWYNINCNNKTYVCMQKIRLGVYYSQVQAKNQSDWLIFPLTI